MIDNSPAQRLRESQNLVLRELDREVKRFGSAANSNINLVGVISALKPAAILDDRDGLVEKLEAAGLSVRETGNGSVVVAVNSDTSDKLAELLHKKSSENTNSVTEYEIGEILGYPRTATEYYIQRKGTVSLPLGEQLPIIQPNMLSGSTLDFFSQIILSPNHWRDELEAYAVPLEQATQTYMPQTYRSIKHAAWRKKIGASLRSLTRRERTSAYSESVAVRYVE